IIITRNSPEYYHIFRELLIGLNTADTPLSVARETLKAAHQVLDYDASVFGIVASDLFSREAPQLPLIPVLLEDTVDGNLIDIKTKNYPTSPTTSTNRCMETGPRLVADRTLEPGFTAHKFENNEQINQSLASFPIKFADENIGVIS